MRLTRGASAFSATFELCTLSLGVEMPGKAWLVIAAAASFIAADANAAEIVLERTGVEKLVVQALFKDQGRLTLTTGPCASYLDDPSVTLVNGRIQIRSHLSARVGFVVNRDCAGFSLSSWTKMSGKPTAAGGVMRLDDIRIDDVDDPNTRTLLVNSGLSAALPRAVELNIQSAVQSMLMQSVNQIQTTVESFDFSEVSVLNDRLSMKFEFKLVGR
jgi:hypothetical protein